MIRIRLLLLAVATFAAALAQAPPPPGLKVTLSQNGITYGKDWAIKKFLPSLQNLHAPDVHGSSGARARPPCLARASHALDATRRVAHRQH
jgi:hypothetical protein